MRICYVCADRGVPLGGRKGASAHARGLVRAFREAGHEVVTVSTAVEDSAKAGGDAVVVTPPALVPGIETNCEKRLARALGHVWTNVALEGVLRRLAASRPPALIYERYGPFGVAGGIVARALGIPHVLEVNAPLAREGATYRRQALPDVAEALERTAFANTTLIVAVSEELREELCEAGADPAKVLVVPNGVDAALFDPRGPRQRLPAGEDGVVIGFVGGLRPWHAVEQLAEAFRTVSPDPRFHLLVVGDGPLAPVVERLRHEHADRVTWIRGVEHADVPSYVRAMDVAVAPYAALERFYYSPLKVLEYMAAGRPVVASAIGQLGRLVRDGETGLLIPPGDAPALAAAIRRLAGDRSLRLRLGNRAAQEARSRHSWSDRAARILERVAARTLRAEAA